jgi:hypothetical protein
MNSLCFLTRSLTLLEVLQLVLLHVEETILQRRYGLSIETLCGSWVVGTSAADDSGLQVVLRVEDHPARKLSSRHKQCSEERYRSV